MTDERARRARLQREDGNTLVLFPAAVLVMFLLASMAIDAALTFSDQRRLADIAAAAANNAASAASDEAYFGEGAQLAIDAGAAAQRVDAVVAARDDATRIAATCNAAVGDDGLSVTVTCHGTVAQLISPARFIDIQTRDITAQATARAAQS